MFRRFGCRSKSYTKRRELSIRAWRRSIDLLLFETRAHHSTKAAATATKGSNKNRQQAPTFNLMATAFLFLIRLGNLMRESLYVFVLFFSLCDNSCLPIHLLLLLSSYYSPVVYVAPVASVAAPFICALSLIRSSCRSGTSRRLMLMFFIFTITIIRRNRDLIVPPCYIEQYKYTHTLAACMCFYLRSIQNVYIYIYMQVYV